MGTFSAVMKEGRQGFQGMKDGWVGRVSYMGVVDKWEVWRNGSRPVGFHERS